MSLSRIPSDEDYVVLLGKAVYDFTYLEWAMKYLGWALDRDFLTKSADYTSNRICKELSNLKLDNVQSADRRQAYVEAVDLFKELVVGRDQLIHSNPYTDKHEGQRLNYRGRHPPRQWLTTDLKDLILQISEAVSKADSLFYSNWIEHPYNVKGSNQ